MLESIDEMFQHCG